MKVLFLCIMVVAVGIRSCMGTAPAVKPDTVPLVFAAGSHYDIGHAYGSTFKLQIQTAMSNSNTLRHISAWVKTAAGKAAFDALTANVAASPMADYLDEVHGVADGAEVDYDTALMFNMQDELGPLSSNEAWTRVPHCSDMLNSRADGTVMLAHNEDADVSSYHNTYFAKVTAPDVSFTAYTYPGALCSGAFGFNDNGVFFSTNAIFPKDISLKGVPRNFFHRYVLASKNISEALHRAQNTVVASGLSMNLGSVVSPNELYNIEISATVVNVYKLPVDSVYAHFNMYLRLSVPQFTSISSIARMARYKELPPPTTVHNMFNILGDTFNSSYPLYRNAAPPDDAMTLVTALFDSHARTLQVFMNNPKTDPSALTSFSIPAPGH